MVKLPAGIKTNPIPRELVKAFSVAKAGRSRRRLDIRINENRMDNLDDFLPVFSIAMSSFSHKCLSCLEIPEPDTGIKIDANLSENDTERKKKFLPGDSQPSHTDHMCQ